MKKLLILSFIFCSIVACQAGSSTAKGKADNPQTQNTQISNNKSIDNQSTDNKAAGVWVDVRSADEYRAGHLAGAVNIVHGNIASQIVNVAPNKDTPIHLYCRSGSRAEVALQTLKKLGYTNVKNHGGYDALIKQGLK